MRKAGETVTPSNVKYPDNVGGGFMASITKIAQLRYYPI
jgi:hypothetical protein